LIFDDEVAVALWNELPILGRVTIAGLLPKHRAGPVRLRQCAGGSPIAPGVVAQTLAPHMIEHGYGRIINIGSVTSVFGYAGVAP
jgi:NAD(P)-dependent dehydrogenase (short-subunit alcohol dehydrogenase family)